MQHIGHSTSQRSDTYYQSQELKPNTRYSCQMISVAGKFKSGPSTRVEFATPPGSKQALVVCVTDGFSLCKDLRREKGVFTQVTFSTSIKLPCLSTAKSQTLFFVLFFFCLFVFSHSSYNHTLLPFFLPYAVEPSPPPQPKVSDRWRREGGNLQGLTCTKNGLSLTTLHPGGSPS